VKIVFKCAEDGEYVSFRQTGSKMVTATPSGNHLLVLGAGGHSMVVADAAMSAGYRRITLVGNRHQDFPLPPEWDLRHEGALLPDLRGEFDQAVVAIGNNAKRLKLHQELEAFGFQLPVIVHPASHVSRHAHLDPGCVVLAGAVMNIGAWAGKAVIINSAAVVEHDCRLGAGSHVSPAAALGGGVQLGQRTWIGIGSVVREGIVIGDDAVVGAGAAVVRDIPSHDVQIGVPARSQNAPM
jgi:sugar O-acyltransferase (sialic acid O-acetyltransferase NeuD family)